MRVRAISILMLVSACGPSLQSEEGGADMAVTLAVTPESAAAGDSVTLTLTNGSEETVGYNLCTSTLERESAGDWEPMPSDRVCTMELRTLEPGAEATYVLEIAQAVGAGTYRFRTNVELMTTGSNEVIASQPFTIGS